MLSTEQEKTRLLMLPNSEQADRKEKGWLLRLVGAAIVLRRIKKRLAYFSPIGYTLKISLGWHNYETDPTPFSATLLP